MWCLVGTIPISLAVIVEIVDLAQRAVIDSFEIYTINSSIKKKRPIPFCPKLYLLKILLLLLKVVLGHVNNLFDKISSFKINFYSKFSISRWFFTSMVTSLYSSLPNFQIDNIVKNFKKSSQKWKFSIKVYVLKRIFDWKYDLCDPELPLMIHWKKWVERNENYYFQTNVVLTGGETNITVRELNTQLQIEIF